MGICTFSGLPRIPGHVLAGEWAGWITVAVTLNLGVEQKEPWKVPGTVLSPHPCNGPPR